MNLIECQMFSADIFAKLLNFLTEIIKMLLRVFTIELFAFSAIEINSPKVFRETENKQKYF